MIPRLQCLGVFDTYASVIRRICFISETAAGARTATTTRATLTKRAGTKTSTANGTRTRTISSNSRLSSL